MAVVVALLAALLIADRVAVIHAQGRIAARVGGRGFAARPHVTRPPGLAVCADAHGRRRSPPPGPGHRTVTTVTKPPRRHPYRAHFRWRLQRSACCLPSPSPPPALSLAMTIQSASVTSRGANCTSLATSGLAEPAALAHP